MPKVLGIDLGTTNSCMAIVEGGEPQVIANAEGGRVTPSIVAVSKTGERLVGPAAKRQAVSNWDNTIFSIKRFMGRKYEEPLTQRDRALVPYGLAKAPNGDVRVVMGGREHSPPEISAMILQKMKIDAEAFLGEPITEAVITVPAYFNDAQRQATKDAGEIAGLRVLRIINEPTAAALAYGLDKRQEETIAVYDLGGGTFDISILELGEGTFHVKATNGDTHLGGDDFDQRIIDWLADEFRREQGIDLRQDRLALQRLKEAAEKAKVELSSTLSTEINLPFITADATGPKHLTINLTRAKLEQLVMDLVTRTEGPCRQALADAGIAADKIDEVVLVGGQTRMPLVVEKVKALFAKEPHKGVNPDEVVAIGAALQGAVLTGEVRDILLLDVTPLTLAIETLGGVATALIERNTTIPTSKSQIFTTAADAQMAVEIHVTQGERPMAADNKSLARFILDGIIPAPRGTPQVEVAFDIDTNGILSVRAKDLGTGREQRVVVHPSSGLAKDEVERIKRQADQFAADDARKRDLAEARNNADNTAYAAERLLREHADKVPVHLKTEVEGKIASLRSLLASESTDAATLRHSAQELGEAIQKVGTSVYQSAQSEPGPDGGPSDPGASEGPEGRGEQGTVEGQYREI